MAALTDKERAKAVLGEEVEPTGDETTTETDTQTEEAQEEPETVETPEEDESDQEKPEDDKEESEKSADSTFTKQFPNLKGETAEEYLPELEKAYDNSFKEALRLNDLLKEKDKTIQESAAIVAQANQIVAQAAPADPAAPAAQALPEPAPTAASPEIEWIRNERRRVMMSAFDEFKTEYPQVLDQTDFERFRLATDGMKISLTASLGREPTDVEIFKGVAGSFGWQPAKKEAARAAAIKENATTGRSPGSQSAARPKPQKVSDAQVDAYLKMFTSKTREDAVKELSEVV